MFIYFYYQLLLLLLLIKVTEKKEEKQNRIAMKLLLFTSIAIALIAQSLSAPVESEESLTRTKRQLPVGFGSSPVGPVDFPVPLTGLGLGVGLGGFGLGGIGGFGLGGLGGLGFGSRVGITGDAPLEQLAIIEGFGPQGHGPVGMGYGG